MAITSLLQDLKAQFLETEAENTGNRLFSDAEFETELANARVRYQARAEDIVGAGWYSSDMTPFTFHENGMVTFEMSDYLGDGTEYEFDPSFPIHSKGRKVYVAEGIGTPVVQVEGTDPAEYQFGETEMRVVFNTARAEVLPVVTLQGWIVDMNKAKLALAERFLMKILTAGGSRGGDLDRHYKRALDIKNELLGQVTLRRSRYG